MGQQVRPDRVLGQLDKQTVAICSCLDSITLKEPSALEAPQPRSSGGRWKRTSSWRVDHRQQEEEQMQQEQDLESKNGAELLQSGWWF